MINKQAIMGSSSRSVEDNTWNCLIVKVVKLGLPVGLLFTRSHNAVPVVQKVYAYTS